MNHRSLRRAAFAFAFLLLAACQDRHQPVRPTVQQGAPATATASAAVR